MSTGVARGLTTVPVGQILVPADPQIVARVPVVTAATPVSSGFGRSTTVTAPSGLPYWVVRISPLTTVSPSAWTLDWENVRATFSPPLRGKVAFEATHECQ